MSSRVASLRRSCTTATPPGRRTRCISFSASTGRVLERGQTNHRVERRVRERHTGGVAVMERDVDASEACVLGGELDEGAADVEAGDADEPGARHLCGKEAGARRDLEHACAFGERRGEARRVARPSSHLRRRSAVLRVPARDGALHREPPVALPAHADPSGSTVRLAAPPLILIS